MQELSHYTVVIAWAFRNKMISPGSFNDVEVRHDDNGPNRCAVYSRYFGVCDCDCDITVRSPSAHPLKIGWRNGNPTILGETN